MFAVDKRRITYDFARLFRPKYLSYSRLHGISYENPIILNNFDSVRQSIMKPVVEESSTLSCQQGIFLSNPVDRECVLSIAA